MAKELTRQRMECGYVSPLWVSWNAKRRHVILLANSENSTVQGAVATWWTRKSLPTKRQVATAPCNKKIEILVSRALTGWNDDLKRPRLEPRALCVQVRRLHPRSRPSRSDVPSCAPV